MYHVRPVLEYAGTVWCPYLAGDREILEKVQKRTVSMITGQAEGPRYHNTAKKEGEGGHDTDMEDTDRL